MPTQTRRSFDNDTITTIKVSSTNLTLLSKILSDLRSRYTVFSASSVMVNQQTRCYFAFLNIKNEILAEQLEEVTPFPGGVKL
jgi:hypothetical protein